MKDMRDGPEYDDMDDDEIIEYLRADSPPWPRQLRSRAADLIARDAPG